MPFGGGLPFLSFTIPFFPIFPAFIRLKSRCGIAFKRFDYGLSPSLEGSLRMQHPEK